MRVSFDDIAAATYAVLKQRLPELSVRHGAPLTCEALAALLAPLLVSKTAPHCPYYTDASDVQKFIRLLYHRCDEAGKGSILLRDFAALLSDASDRLTNSAARTYAEWRYTRDTSAAVVVKVKGVTTKATTFGPNLFTGTAQLHLTPCLGTLHAFFNVLADASISCGVLGDADDGQHVYTQRRVVFSSFRGQVLAVCPFECTTDWSLQPPGSPKRTDPEPLLWCLVSSSMNKMHLFAIPVTALLGEADGSTVQFKSHASGASKSQILVARPLNAVTNSVSKVLCIAGNVVGEVLVLRCETHAESSSVAISATASLHTGSVNDVQLLQTQDALFVVSAGATDGTLALSRMASDGTSITALRAIMAHTGGVTSVAVIPDKMAVASSGSDRSVKLWAVSLELPATLLLSDDKNDFLICSTLSAPSSGQVLALDIKGNLHVWDSRTRRRTQQLVTVLPDRVKRTTNWTSMALLPNNAIVTLTGGPASVAEAHFITDASIIKTCDDFLISAVAHYPQLNSYVTAARCNVKIWDASSGEMTSTFDSVTSAPVTSLGLCADAQQLICGLTTGDVNFISVQTGLLLRKIKCFAMAAVAFIEATPCGSRAFVVAKDGSTALIPTGESIAKPSATALRTRSKEAFASTAVVQSDGQGRVAVLDALDSSLVIWELPNDLTDTATPALELDLRPCRTSPESMKAFCFIVPMRLIAITDGSDLSLIDISGAKPRRRVTWTSPDAPPTRVWWLEATCQLAHTDSNDTLWVESMAHTLHQLATTKGPVDTVVLPTASHSFPLPQASCLAVLLPSAPSFAAATSKREVVIMDVGGATCGRLDSTNSSSSDWIPIGEGKSNGRHRVDDKKDHGGGATGATRFTKRIKLSPLYDAQVKKSAVPPRLGSPVPAPADLVTSLEKLVPPPRHELSPVKLREVSTRTTAEMETAPIAWSVDYPEELAVEVKKHDKSNAVIAAIPQLHTSIRRLRPSAKVLAEDRRNRSDTYNILHPPQAVQVANFRPILKLPPMARKYLKHSPSPTSAFGGDSPNPF